MKKRPDTVLMTAEEIDAADSISKLFSIPVGSKAFHIQRLRKVDGQNIAFQTSFIPLRFCRSLLSKELAKESFFEILKEDFHLKITNADEMIHCSRVDKFESLALQINEGDSIFRLERKTFLDSGELIELARTILPGNKCNLHIRLNLG